MEAEPGESNVLTIGKYVFSTSAFDRAKNILLNALNKKQGWLIIDEAGPLELRGEGFSDVLKEILQQRDMRLQLVLVVRESLVDAVVKFFGIEKYEQFDL